MVLATNKFHMKNATKKRLESLGFKYYCPKEDSFNDMYSYCFIAYKWKKYATIECEITVECDTGVTYVNFYDKATRTIYFPFYNINLHQYSEQLLNKISNNVEKELDRMDIKWK